MNIPEKLPDNLTVTFRRNDLLLLDDMVQVLSARFPNEKWSQERVVHMAVGSLYKQITGEEVVTVGEFLAASLGPD